MDISFVRQVIPKPMVSRGTNISTKKTRHPTPPRVFLLVFLLTIAMLLFPLSGMSTVVEKIYAAANNDPTAYPYKNFEACPNCTEDPWYFFYRQCTSYVAWKVNSNHNTNSPPFFFRNTMFGTSDNLRFGHGGHWDDAIRNALTAGINTWFYVDKVPAVGAVAVWDPFSTTGGTSGIREFGHVAYVESVNLNGTVNVSEYNYIGNSNYGTRSNTSADSYIHFNSAMTSSPTGRINGTIYNTGSLVNYRPTLITATVSSSGVNNTDFYYQKSYLGTYDLTLPSGVVTLRASDGVNHFTIKNLLILPSFNRLYHITLNNQCVDGSTGLATSNCGAQPYITSANYGGGAMGSAVITTGTACTTPPNTTVNVTGPLQGNNGWWRSVTTVSFHSTAPCGPDGIKTYYSMNGSSSQQYSGPFSINQEGVHNIIFYSVDGKGNIESTKSTQVKIDWTPPITNGTAAGPRDTNGIFRDTVNVALNATDNLSGVASQQRSMDGGTNWINYSGNNNTFQISGNGVSRFVFRSTDVAGNVETVKDSGPIIINKYVVFSNATSNSLRVLESTGVSITGDIHSNGTLYLDANTGSSVGNSITTVGSTNTITSSNTNVLVPSISSGRPAVSMLSYPLSLYQSLATVVFPSSLYMDTVGKSIDGIYYVNGDVNMTDVALSGPLSVIATGNITDYSTDSSFQTGDPNNGVLLYSGRDINVNSTGNRNLGLMYAPAGTVYIRATNLNLKGSVVGNQVEINAATGFNLSYNAGFASGTYSLPLSSMVMPLKQTGSYTVAAVPTLSKPSNGASVSASKVTMSWSESSRAIGYQLQISTSSSFGTLVYDGSHLSNITSNRNLQRGKTYYWRVRSINQAGMSSWSSTGRFVTQ
jgi:surface antigen